MGEGGEGLVAIDGDLDLRCEGMKESMRGREDS